MAELAVREMVVRALCIKMELMKVFYIKIKYYLNETLSRCIVMSLLQVA